MAVFTSLNKYKITIDELNLKPSINVTPSSSLQRALEVICSNRMGATLVEENNILLGIITESDFFLKVIGKIHNLDQVSVEVIMTKSVNKLSLSNTVYDYMLLLNQFGHRFVPVLSPQGAPNFISVKKLKDIIFNTLPDEVTSLGTGQMQNIFNDSSIMNKKKLTIEKYKEDLLLGTIDKLPLKYPPFVMATTLLMEAILCMQEYRIKCVLVIKGDQMVGILTMMDILNKAILKKIDLYQTLVEDIMTKNPVFLYKHDIIAQVVNNMYIGNYRNLPILDAQGRPAGMVTINEIVKYLLKNFNAEGSVEEVSNLGMNSDDDDMPPLPSEDDL